MKVLKALFFIFLSLFFFLIPVGAQTMGQGDSVLLPKDKVVNENYFAAGKSVTISGTVNGDAYVAAENILVDGVINGDLLAAGGSITVNGHITGDVRVGGGQITIDGNVDGNITAGGGSVTIAKNAQIGKGIVVGAGQFSLMAPIRGGATIGSGNATIDNSIEGNVLAGVGQLSLSPNASIKGNLTYYAEQQALIQKGATVSGTIQYHKQNISKDKQNTAEQMKRVGLFAGIGFKIYSALSIFLLGLLLIKMFPLFLIKTTEIIEEKPWTAFGIGALIFFLTPIAILLFFISIIGIPFAFITIFAFGMYLYFAKLFIALWAGKKVITWFKWRDSLVLALFLGLLLWIIITSIPVLGGMIQFLIILMGMGTLALTKKHYFKMLKSKNLL